MPTPQQDSEERKPDLDLGAVARPNSSPAQIGRPDRWSTIPPRSPPSPRSLSAPGSSSGGRVRGPGRSRSAAAPGWTWPSIPSGDPARARSPSSPRVEAQERQLASDQPGPAIGRNAGRSSGSRRCEAVQEITGRELTSAGPQQLTLEYCNTVGIQAEEPGTSRREAHGQILGVLDRRQNTARNGVDQRQNQDGRCDPLERGRPSREGDVSQQTSFADAGRQQGRAPRWE